MKNKKLKDKIRKLIVNQFKMKKKRLKKNLSANNVAKWDSLGHLSLITVIEKKFEISFTQEEIIKMFDEREIYLMLLKKNIETK